MSAFCPDWPEVLGIPDSRRSFPVQVDGSFRVDGVTRFLSLNAEVPGRVPSPFVQLARFQEGQGPEIVVLPEEPGVVSGVVLELGPHATPARVRVVDDGLRPLPPGAGVVVRCGSFGGLAQEVCEDGWLELEGVAPGLDINLWVWQSRRADGEFQTVETRVALEPLPWDAGKTVVVPRAAQARSLLKDSNGRTLPGLHLLVRKVDGTPEEIGVLSSTDMSATDATGLLTPFAKRGRPPGTYVLLEGWHGRELWRGSVVPSDPVPVHDVVLPDQVAVRVTLHVEEAGGA